MHMNWIKFHQQYILTFYNQWQPSSAVDGGQEIYKKFSGENFVEDPVPGIECCCV